MVEQTLGSAKDQKKSVAKSLVNLIKNKAKNSDVDAIEAYISKLVHGVFKLSWTENAIISLKGASSQTEILIAVFGIQLSYGIAVKVNGKHYKRYLGQFDSEYGQRTKNKLKTMLNAKNENRYLHKDNFMIKKLESSI